MKKFQLTLAALAALTLSACSGEKETKKPEAPPVNLKIEAPGVDVEVGGGEGVKVNAPGADVDVKKEGE